jgi:hypothetical protein
MQFAVYVTPFTGHVYDPQVSIYVGMRVLYCIVNISVDIWIQPFALTDVCVYVPDVV